MLKTYKCTDCGALFEVDLEGLDERYPEGCCLACLEKSVQPNGPPEDFLPLENKRIH